jgi:hypothetical protein
VVEEYIQERRLAAVDIWVGRASVFYVGGVRMKKLAMMCAFAVSGFAATYTGYISESHCGAKHMDGSKKAEACVRKCVEGGSKPVFVTEDKKILQISDTSKVMDHLGHKVTVTGTIDGDTLKVDEVKMAQ